MPIGELIGTSEAARICGVERSTFFRWVQLGKITPAQQMPGATGALLFDRDDVDEFARRLEAAS